MNFPGSDRQTGGIQKPAPLNMAAGFFFHSLAPRVFLYPFPLGRLMPAGTRRFKHRRGMVMKSTLFGLFEEDQGVNSSLKDGRPKRDHPVSCPTMV